MIYTRTRLSVEEFAKEYRFLSNFWEEPFTWNGIHVPTAEHPYNAAKSTYPDEQSRVYAADTPGQAKRAGQKVTLQPRWEEHVRFEVMESVCAAKFAQDPLRQRLLDTGDALLVEGNLWHDQVWGDCACPKHRAWPGQNRLGQTLMDLRSSLRGDDPTWHPRVALTGHRPSEFTPEQIAWVQQTLATVVSRLRNDHHSQVAICGLAQGADSWWGKAALDGGLELWTYAPFTAQSGSWDADAQQTWQALVDASRRHVVLGTDYDVRLLHARNQLMVRDADLVIAVHLPQKTTGGTVTAIEKALARGRAMLRVNPADREVTYVPAVGQQSLLAASAQPRP